ncbi:MAG: GAF domain-containing protein, partial [Calditrichaeota bacterium]|nr:GAF domain-containing protein [Calditrichota bacterium]
MSNEYLAPQDAGKLQQENLRLRRAVDELTVLNEIATTINSTMNLDSIIGLMVKKCVKHLNVEQAAVSLLDAGNDENSTPLQTMVRQADTSNPVLPYRLDAQLTGWVLKNSKPLLVNNLANDERFGRLASADAQQFRSLLSVPLMSRGEIRGVISVFNKKSGDFTAE